MPCLRDLSGYSVVSFAEGMVSKKVGIHAFEGGSIRVFDYHFYFEVHRLDVGRTLNVELFPSESRVGNGI